jgi:creatinine amidohydrolase
VPILRLAELTTTQLSALEHSAPVALLPVGATEAHGPHLPLATDVIIAEAMCQAAAEKLSAAGSTAVITPPLAFTAASYAAGFAGTVNIRPETVTAVIVDLARALARHGISVVALANAHLDPTHIGSLYAAARELKGEVTVVFPDITRKPWALRLGDEFKSGACHAGQFEGSIVMAARPELVREEVRKALAPNPNSLSRAIREGRTTFEEAGGPQAYFGYPADASAEEGHRTIEALGAILFEAMQATLTA